MSEPQIPRRPDADCFQVNEKTLEKTDGCYKAALGQLKRALGGNEEAERMAAIRMASDLIQNASALRALETAATNFYAEPFSPACKRALAAALHEARKVIHPPKSQDD